jgi:hypothetical protein
MSGSIGDNVFRASGVIAAAAAGRTGTVDWQTGSIKTATFTATTAEGYFCNTSGGVFTVNLPAGVAESIVAVADYTRTFNTNNLTVSPNGSEKIGGVAANATLSVNGQSATFVYVDSTEGWINIQETETSQTGKEFITATGGTSTQSGDYEIRTFTGPGTFCVSSLASCSADNNVDYLVVAGGGGGGGAQGSSVCAAGAGGAGGYRESPGTATGCYTVSPLGAAPATAITVTASPYSITVGSGGAAAGPPAPCGVGTDGTNSIFSTITSTAGGGGGGAGSANGRDGGSGGGQGGCTGSGGSGNTPPTNPAQGTNGGAGPCGAKGSGGGGATAAGNTTNFAGGAGATSSINGTPTGRAGGGGGGTPGGGPQSGTPGSASDGGGAGGDDANGTAGTANTGGGGGGGPVADTYAGGIGGSGVVILRYKYQ